MKKRFLYFIGLLVLSILFLYFGGWSLIIGEKKSFLDTLFNGDSGFILRQDTLAIRFNENYYGFNNIHRFFDSPFISWILWFFGLFGLYYSFKIIIFGVESLNNNT